LSRSSEAYFGTSKLPCLKFLQINSGASGKPFNWRSSLTVNQHAVEIVHN
jgi:hypothetical protein